MKVVVTGATGNVGTSVVEALAVEPGVDTIVGITRRRPTWSPAKTEFEQVDVRSDNVAHPMREASALIHLAWIFQPTHEPLTTWDVNVMGTINVMEAAAAAHVDTIVYASSVGAYSPAPGRQVDEKWPTHGLPTAAYGREKAYLERYLDGFEQRNPHIRLVRIRPCFSFKRESASSQRRIFAGSLVPRAALRPGLIPALPLPPGLQFQAAHTSDIANAYTMALLSDARGAYNAAADPIIDSDALGRLLGARPVHVPPWLMKAAVGTAWRLRLVPSDEELLTMFLGLPTLDTTKIRQELGWQPRHSGIEALQEFLDGFTAGAGAPTGPLRPARPARTSTEP